MIFFLQLQLQKQKMTSAQQTVSIKIFKSFIYLRELSQSEGSNLAHCIMDKPVETRQRMTAGMKREKETQSESTCETEWLIKPECSIQQWFWLSMVLAAQQSALFEVIDFRKAHKPEVFVGSLGLRLSNGIRPKEKNVWGNASSKCVTRQC